MANTVLTDVLSEPLNGATKAKVEINSGSGNLAIDTATGGEPVLASGTLEYVESQGRPMHSIRSDNGQATFTLQGRSASRPWFRFPWAACIADTEWQVHLNPTVATDITAHTGGGNVKLNLTDMAITHLAADSGGGNLDVVLPDHAANLSVAAKTGGGNVTVAIGSDTTGRNTINATSGAGNVTVHVPSGMAAKVHATSGFGKMIVDPRFSRIDRDTYQSPDYDGAANTVEIEAHSGAGNVTVDTM